MESKDWVIVSVQDSGIGIKEENIPYLFDRFYRVDDARHQEVEGTGLGLAIVKQVVDLHEGKIEVESKWNEGTGFKISLPK